MRRRGGSSPTLIGDLAADPTKAETSTSKRNESPELTRPWLRRGPIEFNPVDRATEDQEASEEQDSEGRDCGTRRHTHALDDSTGRDVSLLKRRVTDVAVSDVGWMPAAPPDDYEKEDDAPWFVYVWPSSHGLPLDELYLYRGEDVEQWFDDTGLLWPPEARRQLYEQLPKIERELPSIAVGGELTALRDRAVEALTAANNPPVFFRRGGLVTEIALNEKRVPSAKPVTTGTDAGPSR